MAMLYWVTIDDKIVDEKNVLSKDDFNPPMFSIPANQYVWAVHVTAGKYFWSLWSDKGHRWVVASPTSVPKTLQMRQLIGAL